MAFSNKESVMNKRHKIILNILRPLVALFLKIKFGYKFEKVPKLEGNYIILSNHNTDFDPLFVAVGFKDYMYFVASEHISRWKVAFKFIKFAFDPILRYKGTVATSTVLEVLRRVKAGNNVCIFAEGVRSWDGITCPILPSTGKLVKKSKCGLVTYKITGGYFTSPNWGESGTRKGPISGAPVRIYTPEEIAAMKPDEISRIIERDLYEDAYETQLKNPQKYKGKNIAEKLENLIFICPECGGVDTFKSKGDTVRCSGCGHTFKYNEYGMLENSQFKTVRDYAKWQKEQVEGMASVGGILTSPNGRLIKIENHQEIEIASGEIVMTKNSLRCADKEIELSAIMDMAIHGRHALVFSTDKDYYELLPCEDSNTIKFLFLYDAYKKLAKEQTV